MVEDSDIGHHSEKKKTLINRKLSELFQKLDSRSRIAHEFLIWFGEMERQNWNGLAKNKKGKS